MTSSRHRLGVVIITRDRQRSLFRSLAKLRSLPDPAEVVVVDNGSGDGTPDAVRSWYPDVRLVGLDQDAGAAARTIGVAALETEYVAFCDDDSWWAPGAFAHAADVFDAHPKLGLIAARILVGREQQLDPTCMTMARSPLPASPALPGRPILGFVACGSIVRRTAYLAVGGFEPRFQIGAEEQLLALDLAAAGWQLAYVEEIVAYHHPDPAAAGRDERRVQELRNMLWSVWLRRPAGSALALSGALVATSLKERRARAIVKAVQGLPWVLRERRTLPVQVELAARTLWGGGPRTEKAGQ